MNQRLAQAEAALRAGQPAEAIRHLEAVLEADPGQPFNVWLALVLQLHDVGRYAEGEAWAAKAIQRHPKSLDLRNVRGVLLRILRRFPEALAELEEAWKLDRRNLAVRANRANVLLDLLDAEAAEKAYESLVRDKPADGEMRRLLGRSLMMQGRFEEAGARFRQAIVLDPKALAPRVDLINGLWNQQRHGEANAALDEALAQLSNPPQLIELRASFMHRDGDVAGAAAYLESLLPTLGDAAWLHRQLGQALAELDRERSLQHLRRAVELDPADLTVQMALIENLERTRVGVEGDNIEEAYQRLLAVLGERALTKSTEIQVAMDVLIRVCDFDRGDAMPSFKEMGRVWANNGGPTALLKQLGRVRSHEDRLELIEQHRIWGRQVELLAAANPIDRPPARIRARGDKIRLGLMSSDLRQHPVTYFALPLFDHLDRERFEVFCYSWSRGEADAVQKTLAEQVTGFRWKPGLSPRDAAQLIADDGLDMLIELGGSTNMNKVEVLAWRPAPIQASWLGYPHSAGLKDIDWFVCDRFNAPTDPELLVEKPLVLPHSWLALSRAFTDNLEIDPVLPEERNGVLTFGTANNPHKYSREVLRTWARITAAVPGARFVFIRPEGGSASFRQHVEAEFAAEGVPPERLHFYVVRGGHMPWYNQVDITLDPFPLTGGTTTTEALWMGVPVVSLVGEAFYERLSFSILSNAGLPDLCATTLEDYQRIALALAADRERRRALRYGLRAQMKASPFGQSEVFARDFYDAIARTVDAS